MEETQGRFELQNWRIYGRVTKENKTSVLSAHKSWSLANQHLTQKFLYDWKRGLLLFTWVWKYAGIYLVVGSLRLFFSLSWLEVGRWWQTEAAGSSLVIIHKGRERVLLVACRSVPWLSCFSLPEKSVAVDLFSWHTHHHILCNRVPSKHPLHSTCLYCTST